MLDPYTTTDRMLCSNTLANAYHKYLIYTAYAFDRNLLDLTHADELPHYNECFRYINSNLLVISNIPRDNDDCNSIFYRLEYFLRYGCVALLSELVHLNSLITPAKKVELFTIYLMISPYSKRLYNYYSICKNMYYRAEFDCNKLTQSIAKNCQPNSPFAINRKTAKFNQRFQFADEPSISIHFNPFHGVSCGHAEPYIQALLFKLTELYRPVSIYIWTVANFSINRCLEAMFSKIGDFKILDLMQNLHNYSTLSDAYMNDSVFNAFNPREYPWVNDFNYQELSTLVQQYITDNCHPNISKFLSISKHNIVTLHVRTNAFKPSHSPYETLRNADPNTFDQLLSRLNSQGCQPIFLSGSDFPNISNSLNHIVTDDAASFMQYYLICKSNLMILCSSGVSTLAKMCTIKLLYINATTLNHDEYNVETALYALKNLSWNGRCNLTCSQLCELLLMNWTCTEFTSHFTLQSLSSQEILDSYTDFEDMVKSPANWKYDLISLFAHINPDFKLPFKNFKLTKRCYSNLLDISLSLN